jgi:Lon protease-like protein
MITAFASLKYLKYVNTSAAITTGASQNISTFVLRNIMSHTLALVAPTNRFQLPTTDERKQKQKLALRSDRNRNTHRDVTTRAGLFDFFTNRKRIGGDDIAVSTAFTEALATQTQTQSLETKKKTKITVSETLTALDSLLGEDPKQRSEREADERMKKSFEKTERERYLREKNRERYEERRKRFERAVIKSTSKQRLQAMFLESFLLPSRFRKENKIEFFAMPEELFDKRTNERFLKESSSSSATKGEKKIKRQANEFQIPIIPYGHVVLPGARAKLNLFEPRWLTLFSKLLKEEEAENDRTIMTSFRNSDSNSQKKSIDFSKIEMMKDYESGERNEKRFEIVPGFNRYPEDQFVNTNAFGALFRGVDGKIAGLGVKMEIEAHDVAVDGILLSICARASAERFKVLRIVQTEPYIIVDAIPYEDDFNAATSQDLVEDVTEAEKSLIESLETLSKNDNYYYNAVGLSEFEDPNGKVSIKKILEDVAFKSFAFAEIFLYNKDDVAFEVLASRSAKERADIVNSVAKQMNAGMKYGLNPRNARILRILTFWGSLFAAGSCLSLFREVAGF